MSNDPREQNEETADRSFADILSDFESTTGAQRRDAAKSTTKRRGKTKPGARRPRLRGTVVGISGDFVLIDYGAKSEGVIPSADLLDSSGNLSVKAGDVFDVTLTGYNSEGMGTLSRVTGPRPRDWDDLARAFDAKEIVAGRVTGMIKGGFTVDVGARAFLPASRCGVRDAAEMEKLVGQEIRCRITKLDIDDEDVVVDRRIIAEEEATAAKQRRYAEMKEGDTVRGAVRSFTDYGAFVDIGDVDALLHVGEISWTRVNKPSDVLNIGDQIEAKILKIDSDKRRISISMKQLQAHPWDSVAKKYKTGDRVRGAVTRLMDFGAFVEI